jgi:predicted PolB exonuclease-like 3'-5' exonuclease
MNTLVFDIETVPDLELGRTIYGLGDLSDVHVAKVMSFKQKQARGTDFLPLPQHRIVAISVVLRTGDELHVFSIGDLESPEEELIRRFFDGLERYVPELVSWNGSGFDLPVLHYRAMRHSITAAKYWDVGGDDREFRFNNYLGRFHWRHLDLMDVLAGYQVGGRSSLEQIALLLGFPGKLGMSGAKVWDTWRSGGIEQIRNYCETDVLNTYLVYLRFQLMRGILDKRRHDDEIERLRSKLAGESAPHLQEFLTAWSAT